MRLPWLSEGFKEKMYGTLRKVEDFIMDYIDMRLPG